MRIVIKPSGTTMCLYDEAIDLTALGNPEIKRGSHVEPDEHGRWNADMSPVAGPVLGPFDRRSVALAAEQEWLENHWLTNS